MLVKLCENVRSDAEERSVETLKSVNLLLQLRILRLGFLQDRDVGVGIFPEGEEVLVRRACSSHIALHTVSAGKSQASKSAEGKVQHDSTMGNNFLELATGQLAIVCQ